MRNSILTVEESSLCFLIGAAASKRPGPLRYGGFIITLSYIYTLLRTSGQPVAETSTRQNTTLTRDRQPCPRGHSNSHFQQASGGRPCLRLLGHWNRL